MVPLDKRKNKRVFLYLSDLISECGARWRVRCRTARAWVFLMCFVCMWLVERIGGYTDSPHAECVNSRTTSISENVFASTSHGTSWEESVAFDEVSVNIPGSWRIDAHTHIHTVFHLSDLYYSLTPYTCTVHTLLYPCPPKPFIPTLLYSFHTCTSPLYSPIQHINKTICRYYIMANTGRCWCVKVYSFVFKMVRWATKLFLLGFEETIGPLGVKNDSVF